MMSNRVLLLVLVLLSVVDVLQASTGPSHKQAVNACTEQRIGEACWVAGASYESGKDFQGNSIAKDLVLSVKAYKLGCDFGEGRACFNLGNNLLSGKYTGNASIRDVTEEDGIRYLEKGCQFKHAKSCFNYASVVSSFANGKGQAEWGFRRSCELGIQQACGELAGLEKINHKSLKPNTALFGNWYSPQYLYSFNIQSGSDFGIATLSNSKNYSVGEIIFQITEVSSQSTFKAKHMFADGTWRLVEGRIVNNREITFESVVDGETVAWKMVKNVENTLVTACMQGPGIEPHSERVKWCECVGPKLEPVLNPQMRQEFLSDFGSALAKVRKNKVYEVMTATYPCMR